MTFRRASCEGLAGNQMARESFPAGVAEQLKWYVYRLIDPRNGETFYVGKGRGNRVVEHARGNYSDTTNREVEEREDETDLKLHRIRDIRTAGLEVGHVVHRHGIEREDVAYEVEAALIDAYPGLTNRVGGHGSGDYGSRHVDEIVRQYAAEEFEVKENLMLIYIGRYLHITGDPYESVRRAWKVDAERARTFRLVLANSNGLVIGAYRPSDWIPASKENFPSLDEVEINPKTGNPARWGFYGKPAEDEVWKLYVGKRVPEQYRGKQNPVQYCRP